MSTNTVGTGTNICNLASIMDRETPRSVVARAMRAVPREHFVPGAEQSHAHDDTALPIACGQTISQPSLVAYMTEKLALTAASRVLEIGTGSGYQTAILAEIAAEVFTVERIEQLAREAQTRLDHLGYRNIRFRLGDGALGWADAAPFDAIIVTAAAREVPPALVVQLASGGRLLLPLGEPYTDQELWLIEKRADASIKESELLGVRFVPLITG